MSDERGLPRDVPRPRILIVEDDPDTAHAVGSALAEDGASFDVTGSGEEALRMWTASRHDLLILDLGLAGQMDGIDVFQAVRKVHGRPPRAVILSGSDAATASARALDVPVVLKPFRVDRLRREVRRALLPPGSPTTTS